jgi:hypothetical protein
MSVSCNFNELIPEELKRKMRPHQLTAYQFLMNRLMPNIGDSGGPISIAALSSGAILADDVGTGKVLPIP